MFNMHDTQKVTLLRIDAESSVVVTLWEEFKFGCPEGWYGVALICITKTGWFAVAMSCFDMSCLGLGIMLMSITGQTFKKGPSLK